MINLGIGIPFRRMGAGIDPQAQAHYNRVIADGGLIPSGLVGVNNFFKTVKAIYGTSDITTAISVGLDAQVLGYKLGAGAGTTAGQAAQKLYSCSGSSGDVVQTTAASQPLLLVHSGNNYFYSGATSGNYCSTPNSASATFDGDIDFKVRIVNFVNNQTQVYASKRESSGFVFYSDSSGILNVEPWGVASSVAVANGFNGWIRVIKTSTYIQFLTGTDSDTPTWTQLGSAFTGTYANPTTNTGIFGIGGIYNTSTLSYFPAYCKILRVTKANSVDGTPVVDFNPNQYNAATSQTQWTSTTTGETWTINTGTAATGYKGVLVDRTEVQGDGINDRLLSGTLTSRSTFSRFCATNPLNINIFKGIVGANAADRHYLYATSTDVAIYNGVALNFSGEQANRLALYEGDYNGASGSTLLNNTTSSSGNVGSGSSTVVELFALVDGSFGNVVINTLIDLSAIATTQQKTDTYNYIRSINNNAF
jgi:hypothetical protein